jgi:hypothetical protein
MVVGALLATFGICGLAFGEKGKPVHNAKEKQRGPGPIDLPNFFSSNAENGSSNREETKRGSGKEGVE